MQHFQNGDACSKQHDYLPVLDLLWLCYTTLIFSWSQVWWFWCMLIHTLWKLPLTHHFHWEIRFVIYWKYTILCQLLVNGEAREKQVCICWLIWCECHSATGQYMSKTRMSHLDIYFMASTDLLSVPWKWWMLQNLINIQHTPRKCDGWGCLLLASHHTGSGSVLGHNMWDMLWTKWHWDRFFFEY